MARKQLVYRIDDRPPLPIMILAGAQHVLTLFGATTLVPLIFGPAMGMTTLQIGAFIGCVYFSMGVSTLIQTHPKLGSGLPIVQGSSFSFIPPVMTIIGAYKAMGPDVIMQYVGGALIVGGVTLALLGYSGLIGKIRRFITPVVIGPTIMAIGFTLAPTAIQFNAANYWPISLLVVFLVFFFQPHKQKQVLQYICCAWLNNHSLPDMPCGIANRILPRRAQGICRPCRRGKRPVDTQRHFHAMGSS